MNKNGGKLKSVEELAGPNGNWKIGITVTLEPDHVRRLRQRAVELGTTQMGYLRKLILADLNLDQAS